MLRRDFLQRVGFLAGSALLLETLPARFLFAAPGAKKRRTIVFLFQRGACDGLSLLPPLRDANYKTLRPQIFIPPEEAIKLTADFGLHPACAPLQPLWDGGHLAFVPLAGSPESTRSHFDAQDYMEIGTPGLKSTEDGFWSRALAAGGESKSPLRVVALQNGLPRSLQGEVPSLTVSSLKQFRLNGFLGSPAVANGFEGMYEQAVNESLKGAGDEAFSALKMVEKVLEQDKGADYPKGKLPQTLREIAQLIKGDVGLELAVAEMGGWDSHVNQGAAKGSLANHFSEWAGAIGAFAKDLGPRINDVLFISVTEFGRTVRQNGSGGTDHGHGSVFTFAGAGVKGGVLGAYPELKDANLFEGRDMPVAHDFRDLFAAAIARQWGIKDFTEIFPGHATKPMKGLFG
ncbi:MAG: DUF1501 domain-containing protein [Bdellovibrionota bacterium]